MLVIHDPLIMASTKTQQINKVSNVYNHWLIITLITMINNMRIYTLQEKVVLSTTKI